MTDIEERGMVIFSMSFTAGLAAVFIFQSILYSPIIASLSFSLAIITCLFALRKDAYRTTGKYLIFILPLLCGLVCGLTSLNIPYETENPLITFTSVIGVTMRNAIDNLPFANQDSNDLVKALITGDRTNLSPAIYKAFRDSGAAHILALSGFHLGIIYLILSRILSPLGNSPGSRKIKSILLIILTGIYSFATGGAPSIIRAFIFICLRETARLLEREVSLKQVFFTALTLQLIFFPKAITSIGFQLSYLAVAGIIYIYPYLKLAYPNEKEDKSWMKSTWNTAAMSISCQAMTTPLAWMIFGTFPKYFLLTNNIAIPLTGLIIPFSIVVLILNSLGLCPVFVIEALEFLLDSLIFSLKTISTM